MSEKFGRYTVIAEAGRKNDMRQVLCRCDCGTERVIYYKNLKSGNSKSCGCLASEHTSARNFKHGGAKTPTWSIWVGMKQRCSEASAKNKEWYFDRGIRVCERWNDYRLFLADMGERPAGMQLDRVNNDGNYEPSNCRWATPKTNSRNTRRNHVLEYEGASLTIAEWSERLGWPAYIIINRLRCGWTIEKALTTAVRNKPGCRDQCRD